MVMTNVISTKNKNLFVGIALNIFLLYPMLMTFTSMLIKTHIIPINLDKLVYILYLIATVTLSMTFFELKKEIKLAILIIYILFFLWNSLVSSLSGNLSLSFRVLLKMYLISFPLISSIFWISNREVIERTTNRFGIFLVLLVVLFYSLTSNYTVWRFEQGLSISLVLMFYTSVMLYSAFRTVKLSMLYLFFSLVLIVSLFLFSSRTMQFSSLLCLGILVIHWLNQKYMAHLNRKEIIKLLLVVIIVTIMLIIVFIYLAPYLYNYLLEKGMYVRFLRLISDGEMFNSSGRFSNIYPVSFDIVKKYPLGVGIGGEKYYISQHLSDYSLNFNVQAAAYSHNIILEIFTSFGLVLGVIILSFFIISIARLYINSEYKSKILLLCLVSSGVLPLLLTSSFTVYRPFWVCVAYTLKYNFDRKLV